MPTEPKRPARPLLPLLVAAAAAVLLACAGALFISNRSAPAQVAQTASIGGPFTLVNGDGKTVRDTDFRGKFMLVYFGYTFCPDVCPTTLNDVSQAIDKLGAKADRLQPLFITIDPARDTPPVMRQYTAAFTPRLEGLTGTPEQIATVAKEYRVYYAPHRTGPNPEDYLMDHSSILYVVGPDGQFRGIIRADEDPETLARSLAKYVG
ncbi:MAG: SCO family protein [Alphaproteobacteria bacterium]|nr:MAG: SCO family protein [Alphaproteobacteria bacterium]